MVNTTEHGTIHVQTLKNGDWFPNNKHWRWKVLKGFMGILSQGMFWILTPKSVFNRGFLSHSWLINLTNLHACKRVETGMHLGLQPSKQHNVTLPASRSFHVCRICLLYLLSVVSWQEQQTPVPTAVWLPSWVLQACLHSGLLTCHLFGPDPSSGHWSASFKNTWEISEISGTWMCMHLRHSAEVDPEAERQGDLVTCTCTCKMASRKTL